MGNRLHSKNRPSKMDGSRREEIYVNQKMETTVLFVARQPRLLCYGSIIQVKCVHFLYKKRKLRYIGGDFGNRTP